VGTVSLSYPESALATLPAGSGFLVPRSPTRVVTACTFMDRKWPHLRRENTVLLRASIGSAGDATILEMDDATIISATHNSLRSMLPISGLPRAAIVRRWQPALPQYRAGQMAWAKDVGEGTGALDAPLTLAGASYSGVGIAACLQHAEETAHALLERALATSSGTGSRFR
jgi:oxygen-dependent protoporphyrinogen oxidase